MLQDILDISYCLYFSKCISKINTQFFLTFQLEYLLRSLEFVIKDISISLSKLSIIETVCVSWKDNTTLASNDFIINKHCKKLNYKEIKS